jgi:hypothetical protein
MRKYGVVLALIVLSVAVWAASASAISSPKTFDLLEVSGPNSDLQINGFTFDRPPVGGDQFAFVNGLYKWAGTKKGARIGHDKGIATVITGFGPDFSRKALLLFTAQAYLPGGTVLVEGYGNVNADGPSTFTLPVIGGTGTYANARGYVVVSDIGDGNQNKSNLQFHLLP